MVDTAFRAQSAACQRAQRAACGSFSGRGAVRLMAGALADSPMPMEYGMLPVQQQRGTSTVPVQYQCTSSCSTHVLPA